MEKIAVLGPKGTFSESAASQYALTLNGKSQIVYYPTIDRAVYAADTGECDTAVVPLENTLDGYVQRTLDLLLECDVKIISEITVPVKFSLLVKGNTISDLKRLYVQFKASGQCRRYIDTLNAMTVTTQSNTESYELISEQGDGAVVPYHIAQQCSGMFCVDDITDSNNNFTRFVVIKKSAKENESADLNRVPLFIIPQTDRPGLLSDALKVFAEHSINLTSIMSRPQKTGIGHYNFYIELEKNPRISEAIDIIKKDFICKVLTNK